MKIYLLNYPRPIGVEPRIRFTKPNIGDGGEDYFNPSILEFNSIQDALSHIIDFNNTDEYLRRLTIEEIPE